MVSSCLNAAGTIGRMMVNERIEAGRRERRVLARSPGPRGGWRAVRERTRALVSARAEGISIRILAAAAGVSPSRVHQLVAGADLDALGAVLASCGQRAGQPPRIQAQGRHRTRRPGHQADRLSDEVSRLRQCADWLTHLDADSCPHSRLPPQAATDVGARHGTPSGLSGLDPRVTCTPPGAASSQPGRNYSTSWTFLVTSGSWTWDAAGARSSSSRPTGCREARPGGRSLAAAGSERQ